MTDPRKFQVEHPIAQRLADLSGIANDLRLAIRAAEVFLSSPTVGSEAAIIGSKSLASFAIITYFRTLATGVRTGVSLEQIEKLSPALQRTHHRLKTVRDGYVAHSLSSLERNIVEVGMSPDGAAIETLSTTHSRPGTFSREDVLALKELTEALHELVDEESDAEFDRVWEFLEAMPSQERSKVLVVPKPYQATTENNQRRRKFGG
jgi:hypothetical protein